MASVFVWVNRSVRARTLNIQTNDIKSESHLKQQTYVVGIFHGNCSWQSDLPLNDVLPSKVVRPHLENEENTVQTSDHKITQTIPHAIPFSHRNYTRLWHI